MKFKTVFLAILTLVSPLFANATVKPTVQELMGYSTLVATATINSIDEPYINQKVVSLNVVDVLAGELSSSDVVLTVLDNTVINKGIHDFVGFQTDGKVRIYFLKFINGEYSLSDSWFGIAEQSQDLMEQISDSRRKI